MFGGWGWGGEAAYKGGAPPSLIASVHSIMSCCRCGLRGEAERGSILFSLLNRGAPAPAQTKPRSCSCASSSRLVSVRAPQPVFTAACRVLATTFRLVKSAPCFGGLPAEDQRRLVRRSWAPLLVLGLARDSVDLDTVETRQTGLLHGILTHSREPPGVPVGDVEGLKQFVVQCRGLRISVREDAFLKGALIFSPAVTQPACREYVRALQMEAERALYEHVRTARRARRLRAVLAGLRSTDPHTVAGIFFRPVTGTSYVDEHVLAMFNEW
ncbi:nuclear receptor subfamily 0 group B member 1-like [Echeneis naucrates]|uniref:Nuclear receptor subfamily 0 group B member 1-like n=1 Tax=Echeneis naucrates TaxID=173247 RepID=A0A665U844_ECHNA|nr:nuclear receptor subfamily 0 group B member 1-like [Echeneis naucrates]